MYMYMNMIVHIEYQMYERRCINGCVKISITLTGTFLKGYLIVLLRLRLHKHFDIKFRQLLIKYS